MLVSSFGFDLLGSGKLKKEKDKKLKAKLKKVKIKKLRQGLFSHADLKLAT